MNKQDIRFNEDTEKFGGQYPQGFMQVFPGDVDDANLAQEIGQYGTTSSTLNLPPGTETTGTLLVQSYSDVGTQIYIPHNHNSASQGVWVRAWQNDSAWLAWEKLGGDSTINPDDFAVRVSAAVDDCNDAIVQGMYYTDDGSLNIPIAGQWGGLYVSGSGTITGVVTQLHINHAANSIHMRALSNDAWSSWMLIPDKAYIDNNFIKNFTQGDIEQNPDAPSHSLILARVGLPDGAYHYVLTFEYATTSGNLGQLAIPYNGGLTTYVRYKYSDAWSAWTGYLPLTGGSLSGALSVTGAITATGDITAFSDKRVKKNFKKIDNALEKVQALTGYTFDRSDSKTERQTGLLAQDVRKVLPEAVRETDEGILTLAYGNLAGLLVESIKELKAEIEELKNAK